MLMFVKQIATHNFHSVNEDLKFLPPTLDVTTSINTRLVSCSVQLTKSWVEIIELFQFAILEQHYTK